MSKSLRALNWIGVAVELIPTTPARIDSILPCCDEGRPHEDRMEGDLRRSSLLSSLTQNPAVYEHLEAMELGGGPARADREPSGRGGIAMGITVASPARARLHGRTRSSARLVRWSLFVVALAVATRPLAAQPWDGAIVTAMSEGGIPGLAALVVQGDETLLSRGYGVSRVGEPEPVTEETLFQVGSLTKAVTATAVAVLVGEGLVSWDDPVQEHLPGFRLADPWVSSHMTVRDVLAMRSGIVSGDTIALFSPNDRPEILAAASALEAPRFRETYGLSPNLMYFLAGQIVAAKSGVSWDEFVHDRILEPLGMSHTTSFYDEAEGRRDYAWPHVRRDGRTVPRSGRARADNVAAAAGLASNIVDWSRWVRFNLDGGVWNGGRLVDPEALAETRRPQILLTPSYQGFFNPDALLNAYGFGWVVSDYRGRTLVEHGGTLPGNASIIALVPEEDIGIVLMSNLALGSAIPTLLELKFRILDDLLDEAAR